MAKADPARTVRPEPGDVAEVADQEGGQAGDEPSVREHEQDVADE